MPPQDAASSLSLVVRRLITAPQDAVFAAWTEPAHLLKWWGPRGVTLAAAEIDLRVGGRYRLANKYEDGSVLWITGVFEVIDRPRRITYTWAHEPADDSTTESTRVTVRFVHRDQGTEVIVVHQRIRSARSRRSHRAGWVECLDGLAIVGPTVLPGIEAARQRLPRSARAAELPPEEITRDGARVVARAVRGWGRGRPGSRDR